MAGELLEQPKSEIAAIDLRKTLVDILSSYSNVHSNEGSRPGVSVLFDSLKQGFYQKLAENGTKDIVIKWSYPKPSWAFVPWIAFLDKRNEDSMSSGIYCCILFRSDMKGLYLTLIQGVTQYKNVPKIERLRQLQLKNEIVRKKLNYLSTHGFSVDDQINLMAPAGSAGGEYDKATVLYKYYPIEAIPEQRALIKDIQTIIDAYRVYSSQEGHPQSGETSLQATVNLKVDGNETTIKTEENFLDYLKQKGFSFTPDIVISYLLSLKVKPFVILTGPSGCGKTKLAQLFAQYQAEKNGSAATDYIVTDVKVGKSANHEGWTFPRTEFFNHYPELNKFQGLYDIEVDGISGRGNLELLTRLFFEPNEEIKKRLESLALIDPSRRITLKIFVPSDGASNYEIIPVGANWTENRHIVGFYNLITKEYQRTKALNLILSSQMKENEGTPFFMILDEMNLSHVERYFADFLSAIESDEKIHLHSNGEEAGLPGDIQLNPNLMIVGTVNVDETTYMFSPKVLDRANTIEILSGSISDYLVGRADAADIMGDMTYLEAPLKDAAELRSLTIGQIRNQFNNVTAGGGTFWDAFSLELNKFQSVLKEVGLDFGFRVVNEISRFLLAAWRFEGKPTDWTNWKYYFDMQIKQKMLPKVHGSERSLGKLIENLFQLCLKSQISKAPREHSEEELIEKAIYRSSAMKLKEMDMMLYSQRHVSFTR